jgi:membrane fusion protein (multidrug efflux system)
MATPFVRTTRALATDSSRGALVAWAVASLFLAAWAVWFFTARVAVYETSRAARLEAREAPHAVAAVVSGKLAKSDLAIGRTVHAGDVLAELDAGAERLKLAEEQARAHALPARIAALRDQIAALGAGIRSDRTAADSGVKAAQARVRDADAGVRFAADNARRMDREAGSGSIAEIDALRSRTDLARQTSTRDALAAEARRLDLDTGTRALQTTAQIDALKNALASLDGELATSRATAERLELEIERHRLRAPVDGVVAEVQPIAVGAFVAEGQKLATIVPAGDLIVVAAFTPSQAIGRLVPGQHAQMRLDGYPWAQYGVVDATVARVSGEWREGTLRVELVPHDRGAGGPPLVHGLPGTVEVRVEDATPAQLLLRASGRRLATASATDPIARTEER